MSNFFVLGVDGYGLIVSAITALAIVVVAWVLNKYLTKVIHAAVRQRMKTINDMSDAGRERRTNTVAGSLSKVTRLAIWIVAGITAASEFGVNVAPVITGLGIGVWLATSW